MNLKLIYSQVNKFSEAPKQSWETEFKNKSTNEINKIKSSSKWILSMYRC